MTARETIRTRESRSRDTSLLPDNAAKVTDWLKGNKGKYFRHACVSAGTGVKPQAQVNEIIRPLGTSMEFRYMKTNCSECAADRNCVGYFG